MLKTTKKYETNTVDTTINNNKNNNVKNNIKSGIETNVEDNTNYNTQDKNTNNVIADTTNPPINTNFYIENKPNIETNELNKPITKINKTNKPTTEIEETSSFITPPTTQINKTSSLVLSKYMDVFNSFIDYDNKSFELNVLLNKCVYDFNYKYLFEYLVYNIKSTFLFAKDTMYLMFLLNKNMNIVFKYLVNSLLFIGLFFILLLVLSILTLVYMVIGIVSCTLFIITFPFKLIHKLLLKNKKDDEEDNDEDSNENNNKSNKENINKNNKNKKFFLFFRRKNNNRNNNNNNNSKNRNNNNKSNNNSKNNNNNRNKNNSKRNIEQEIILKITGNEKGKKLSRIKTIILKLLNKVSIIFTKLNKQLQIKFIDKKVTNYNKHATKKMKSRTKVISNSLGIKDNSKERLNSKYQVIKKLSSMVKSCDKSSYFKPKEKLKIKEAKTSVIKGLKNEIKSEKEKLKTTKINLDKTKSKIKTGTFIKSSNNKNKEKDKEKIKTKEKNEIINKEKGKVEMKTQNKGIENDVEIAEYNGDHNNFKTQEIQQLLEEEEQVLNDKINNLWDSFNDDEEETLTEEAEVRSDEIDNIELHGLEDIKEVESKAKNGTENENEIETEIKTKNKNEIETNNENEIEIETNNETTDSFVEKLNEGRNKDKETEVGM